MFSSDIHLDSSRSISMMQFQLNSLLSTLELSMEKLCNSFWMRGSRDTDSSMTDSGRIEGTHYIVYQVTSIRIVLYVCFRVKLS